MQFDEYMGFTWKNIHSSTYNCFIINDKQDLKIINAPSFSNEYVQPMFGDKNYLLGTNSTYKNLSFKICVHDITLDEYRDFLKWLDKKSVGDLYLDYDPDYGYTTKLSSISESNRYPLGRDNKGNLLFHAELTIGFDTINSNNAHNRIYNLDTFTSTNLDSNNQINISIDNNGIIDIPFEIKLSNFIGTIIIKDITDENNIIDLLNLTLNIDENDSKNVLRAGFEYNSELGLVTWCGKLLNNLEFHNNTIFQQSYARTELLSYGTHTLQCQINSNITDWSMIVGYEQQMPII